MKKILVATKARGFLQNLFIKKKDLSFFTNRIRFMRQIQRKS